MDSLYQTVNELVGNVDWGESLPIVAYEFPGPNTSKRVYKKWTLYDNHISPKQPEIVNKESKL